MNDLLVDRKVIELHYKKELGKDVPDYPYLNTDSIYNIVGKYDEDLAVEAYEVTIQEMKDYKEYINWLETKVSTLLARPKFLTNPKLQVL